ncbi:pyridoxal phosphate-dependent aminotransferase [Bryobacter aggregatus]|uniref:pyridoxal phosphate-dependent aminotransferase n=1 Tax=Bryobacter aggregatus TaxID=360054 RepID=UPI0004E0CCC5|nr:pyridoxal phosphate-dependent aminotransferase [Bryobacter aggregatus]
MPQLKGYSRRHAMRAATILTAGAALPFYHEFAMAQDAAERPRGMRGAMPADAVRIGSNENPLGPCAEACEAIAKIAKYGGRYSPFNEQGDFIRAVSEVEELKPEFIAPYAGSSDPLHRSVLAFTSPTKGLVMGDPGYEAGAGTAKFVGVKVTRVALQKATYAHDVKAMLAADPNAGVYYICNPNNPTGTITKREDLEWLLANKNKDSILLLDEAYIHFSQEMPGSDLVAKEKDVIVLRTFSKAFGMAGIRCGMAMGRPDLLAKLRPYGSGMLPITGLVAGTASYRAKGLVAERREINARVRGDVLEFLEKKNIQYIPSVSNKFMMEAGRPGAELARALAAEKIFIGRTWPVWPTMVRVTVGTQAEMNQFKTALAKVMS